MNRRVLYITIVFLFILFIILIFDYFNLLFFVSSKLNYNFLSITIGTITTIYLFLVTYFLIDKKINDNEAEKKLNKKNALYTFLNETYCGCRDSITFFEDHELLMKYVIPKVDFNATNDPFTERQMLYPFKYDNKILDLVSDGIVDKDILHQYFNIKESFRKYIQIRIAFFDLDSPKYNNNDKVITAREEFTILEKQLKQNLNKAVKDISNKMKEE